MDGDGLADILYDRNDVYPATPGQVSVRSSATGAAILELDGNANFEFFGAVIAPAGDLNAAGRADILVSTIKWMGVFGDQRCQAYSGGDGSLLHDWAGLNPLVSSSGANTGPPVAALGDVDGDGFGDVAVGDSAGVADLDVCVMSGQTGATLWSLPKPSGFDQWGTALVAWPDLDGDGVDDLAIAAPFASGEKGRVRIVSGADGATLLDLAAGPGVKKLGNSMARGPDLSGDGVDDVLMACTPGIAFSWPAHVRVVSGVCDGEVIDYGSGLAGTGAIVPTLSASISAIIPDEPLLSGLSIYFQLAVIDAGAPKGIAFSAGQEWPFG